MVTNGPNFTFMGAFYTHPKGLSDAKETPRIREGFLEI